MGRGRGKGKRLTVVPSHEDPGSEGEEVLPAYKRRGRPQKPLKDEVEEEVEKMDDEEEGGEVKVSILKKEPKSPMAAENGKKRKKHLQVKETSDSLLEENSVVVTSNMSDSTISNGFRHNGSRRKSKPRRAAEAGVDCK